jgi:hypothetical protein
MLGKGSLPTQIPLLVPILSQVNSPCTSIALFLGPFNISHASMPSFSKVVSFLQLIMEFFAASCYFLTLTLNYHHQQPVPKHTCTKQNT